VACPRRTAGTVRCPLRSSPAGQTHQRARRGHQNQQLSDHPTGRKQRSCAITAGNRLRSVTAAICLTAWSHQGRVRSEAAFASLAGVNPIPASSGNTIRYRLNRGGDRTLSKALHLVALSRMTFDAETIEYVEKRQAQGWTKKEIRRTVKRYLARRIYRTLNATNPNPCRA
jgi:hypothetical protein